MAGASVQGLQGRRVLVVGASSGIGRATALGAVAGGASVVLAARREDLLHDAAAEARALDGASAGPTPPVVHTQVCDAGDPDMARAAAPLAAQVLGGLDTVVYAAGISLLGPVASLSARQWHQVLDTNVVGAAQVVAGALGPLRGALDGTPALAPTVVFLSSHIVARPWPGLVSYAASKAALDALARGLRQEEPWLRVVDVVVGNTVTSFADGWEPDLAAASLERWSAGGYLDGPLFAADDMAAAILGAVGDPDGPDDLDVAVSGGRTG